MEQQLQIAVLSGRHVHPCIETVNRSSISTSALDIGFRRSVLSQQRLTIHLAIQNIGSKRAIDSTQFKFNASWSLVSYHSIQKTDADTLIQLLHGLDTNDSVLALLRSAAELLSVTLRYGAAQYYQPTSSTRLIAVLGACDPLTDDWLISDFCLLHKVFGDVAQGDHWLASTTCRLGDFIKSTGKDILHGNQTQRHSRRVVFSKDDQDFCSYHAPQQLKSEFLDLVRAESAAAKPGERILVIIVSHGNEDGDVSIGDYTMEALVGREELESCLSVAVPGIGISILNTACFSGLWTVDLSVIMKQSSILAASKGFAYSYPESSSLRHRGSSYVGAIAEETSKMVRNAPISGNRGKVSPPDTNARPLPLIRAMCLGDLPTSAATNAQASAGIGQFYKRVATSIKTWPGLKGALKGEPKFSTIDSSIPARMVLGMDDKVAMLWKVEGIRNLKHEDTFTSIALGVGTLERPLRQRRGVHNVNKHQDAWYEPALHMIEVQKAPLVDGVPQDLGLLKFRSRMEKGLLEKGECERYWKMLCYRHRLNCLAEKIVQAINPGYNSIAAFEFPRIINVEPYKHLLKKYLNNGIIGPYSPSGYLTHGLYVAAAARAAKTTVEQLERVMFNITVPTSAPNKEITEARNQVSQRPKIPERRTSIGAVERTHDLLLWDFSTAECRAMSGSWASVSSLNLVPPKLP